MSKANGSAEASFPHLIVQKYGGATLADSKLVRAAAERVAAQSKKSPLIVVVSAMGTTTNSLISLASEVSQRPARRELDMLLSVGERISMSLLSMALQDLGVSAISFTGSQAGILTDDDHFNAKIIDIRAHRVQEALAGGKVVILAGFQGVSPTTKEITTLGRGGSDVSAVAMAAAFSAERCEILKEVPAIFTGDPRVIAGARPLLRLGYDELLEMTFWGAKVLHYRSVELAKARDVKLYIGPAAEEGAQGTLVSEGGSMYETHRPLSLNSHESVLEIELSGAPSDEALQALREELSQKQIAFPQLLSWQEAKDSRPARVLLTGPEDLLKPIRDLLARTTAPRLLRSDLCSVTLTCSGSVSSELTRQVLGKLREANISAHELRISTHSLTLFLPSTDRRTALQSLHQLL